MPVASPGCIRLPGTLNSGARALVTSSYQASVKGFVSAGVGPNDAIKLVRKTTALAVEARGRFADKDPTVASDVLIAASVGSVAYPNGGQGWNAAAKAWHGSLSCRKRNALGARQDEVE